MNPGGTSALVAGLLFLAAFVATAATLRGRNPGWRAAAALQWLVAGMTYLVLIPPSLPRPSDALAVMTSHVAPASARLPGFGRIVVALPGADAPARVERVPDLATALRRYPAVQRVEVLGDGLGERDRGAIGTRGLQFRAAAPYGLLDLQLPREVREGTEWFVSGRVAAAGTRLELRDPSGALVDTGTAGSGGRFRLGGIARAAGFTTFLLTVFGEHQDRIDSAAIPVDVTGGAPLRAILRVGAPDPEFKYWRRWAGDAGMSVSVAAGLSEGIALRDGETALTPSALTNTDLVIVDERAWVTLTDAEKNALGDAVQGGLGLLLRADGPLAPTVAAEWSALGFPTSPTDSHAVMLDHRLGLHERSAFTAAPIALDSTDAFPLLVDDDGRPLAWWRSRGSGRVGLWGLLDSYRLVLAGEPARFGTLWSEVVGQLARVRGTSVAPPRIPEEAWVDERLVLCGLSPGAEIVVADETPVPLEVDGQGCAGYWPASSGWQQVRSAGQQTPFYVRSAQDARTLHAALDGRATSARVREVAEGDGRRPTRMMAVPRWPLFLAWLLSVAGLWWRERTT